MTASAPSPARQGSIRDANLALLYRLIVDAPAPVSRAALAATTGMTRATASTLADALLAAGLVEEVSPPPATGAGRPAAGLVPAASGPVGLGLEINVDYLAACVVDLTGTVRHSLTLHGDQRGRQPDEILADLAGLARKVSDTAALTVAGTAVAVPGLVEGPHGRIRRAPNLVWQDVEIEQGLRDLLPHTPFDPVVGNEADFAALAEAQAAGQARAAGDPRQARQARLGGSIAADEPGARRSTGRSRAGGDALRTGPGSSRAADEPDARERASQAQAGDNTLAAQLGGSSAADEPDGQDRASQAQAGDNTLPARLGGSRAADEPDARERASQAQAGDNTLPAQLGGSSVSARVARQGGPLTDFLYVSGEIGVGAGIVLGSELFRGARGWAGEIGHVTVEPDGARCRCGARGCLETVAGLEALLRTGPEAAAGALGRAVATAVNLLDLPAVVLGGVYARPEFARVLLPAVEATLAEHVVSAGWAPVGVYVSRLGETAAAQGAAVAVVRRIHADPAGWVEVLTRG